MQFLQHIAQWIAGKVVRGVSLALSWLTDLFWQVATWLLGVMHAVWEWLPLSDPFETWFLGDESPVNMQEMLDHAIAILEVVDVILWLVPVGGVAIIYITTYSACGTVRLVRWVLAFVPGFGA